jgi:hypothetical protein
MRLITGVTIRGLRSLQNASVPDVGALTALVGRNSSGKSNILRALNLFFNDELDPGQSLVLQRDFHSRPQANKKRRVVVGVDFSLPQNFTFRKGLTSLQKALGSTFTIRRSWSLNAQKVLVQTTELIKGGGPVKDGEGLANSFLALIAYRYIPNRTVPAALLRDESQVIAASIFAKLQAGSGAQDLMTALRSAADRLLEGASASMQKSGAPLTSPSIASTASLAEMLQVSGFQARGLHGSLVRDEQWGAGNQAFFLYEVLQAIDTNYSRSFGWKQAAVWGVEEPESGLHRDLETRLAEELRIWSADDKKKLQIVQTTHSPIFAMASDKGYWVELRDGASTIEEARIPNLVRQAERRGVTGWVQPILAYPTNPVVLVEGKADSEILAHVATLMGLDRLRFVSLPELDPAETGAGKDAIATYLKRHGGLLANRPPEYPLLVLLDWEVSIQDLQRTRQAYGKFADHAVMRMNPAHCDGMLSEDFKGIERFYPPHIVTEAVSAHEFAASQTATGKLTISTSQLTIAKGRLRARVMKLKTATEVHSLCKVVDDVRQAVSAIVSAQPPFAFSS